ncbi:MAG TPA: HNH endonuclease, partial [Jatrophihabitans sp.]|nr:HNH endonuclease [Jatrophihabitans sp.]
RFVQLRDEVCRTPWCGAPIRHIDHVVPAEQGGSTSVANAEGLCAACNYAKTAAGWRARVAEDGTVTITTPTGHQYQHRAPDPPGDPPSPESVAA